MQDFLNIILNQYVFLFASALVIIGLTQLIKLIPCFKNNNWNVTFPVLFGYGAAFGWAIATQCDLTTNMQDIMLYGTGITSLSTLLYSVLKKIFSKDYKMSEEIKNNELYNYISNLLTTEVKEFSDKTTMERYGFIISVVSSMIPSINAYKEGDKDEANNLLKDVLSKFIKVDENSNILNNLMDIIKKNYNIPETNKEKAQPVTLVKPQ